MFSFLNIKKKKSYNLKLWKKKCRSLIKKSNTEVVLIRWRSKLILSNTSAGPIQQ